MAYVVSAVWTAKPGKEDLVRDVIRQLTPLSRAEPGCRFYQPHADPAEPRVFRLFEMFVSFTHDRFIRIAICRYEKQAPASTCSIGNATRLSSQGIKRSRKFS